MKRATPFMTAVRSWYRAGRSFKKEDSHGQVVAFVAYSRGFVAGYRAAKRKPKGIK